MHRPTTAPAVRSATPALDRLGLDGLSVPPLTAAPSRVDIGRARNLPHVGRAEAF
jgi:hypothetical protein